MIIITSWENMLSCNILRDEINHIFSDLIKYHDADQVDECGSGGSEYDGVRRDDGVAVNAQSRQDRHAVQDHSHNRNERHHHLDKRHKALRN